MAFVLSCAAVVEVSTVVFANRAAGDAAHPRDHQSALGVAVDRYASFDASLGILLDIFRPALTNDAFFRTVRAAGDATDDVSLRAVPLQIADVHRAPAAARPHIFIVVIDSMRPDYLSPYNNVAAMTPAIGAFARESVVFRRAFTQYAGTALSQPAIWAGALIQRAMYVKPFAAVNNLERLTVANGYRRYISIDPPLNAILEDWSGITRLDSDLTHPERMDQMYKFDLCRTIPELTGRIDRDGASAPIFFYSQPQNIHIRALAGDTFPTSERVDISGTSFFKPAVAALSRVDACFGQLIAYLKVRQLYDDSIVILTADHGDSYGEAGRWGHAFYLAPETLRIRQRSADITVGRRCTDNRCQSALPTTVTAGRIGACDDPSRSSKLRVIKFLRGRADAAQQRYWSCFKGRHARPNGFRRTFIKSNTQERET
jgi:hypothetical protein